MDAKLSRGAERSVTPLAFNTQEFLMVFPNNQIQSDSMAFRQSRSSDFSSSTNFTTKSGANASDPSITDPYKNMVLYFDLFSKCDIGLKG